jgi:hypothetical protein
MAEFLRYEEAFLYKELFKVIAKKHLLKRIFLTRQTPRAGFYGPAFFLKAFQ